MSRCNASTRHGDPCRRNAGRRGFTFIEILFAIILLGIGFIMVAGIFPFSIRQTEATLQETVGSALGSGAVKVVEQIATDANLPPTAVTAGQPGYMVSFRDPIMGAVPSLRLWSAVSGNLILSEDTRYAWTPFYKRDLNSDYAQIVVIGVQARETPTYIATRDLQRYNAAWEAQLEPKAVKVTITRIANSPDHIAFNSGRTGAAAPNGYVVISHDSTGGVCNGYVYRIGNQIDSKTFELIPGNDTTGNPVPGANSAAYIVGKAYQDPQQPNTGYAGPAQDVCVYIAFVRIH